MKVLSLFDGMSCGQIALERAGIKVDKYYASEIDKYAVQITKKNYPNTIQLGDIKNIRYQFMKGNKEDTGYWLLGEQKKGLADDMWKVDNIDLIIGGSPCQGFSFAGKQLNFEDERSKLFFEYVRLIKEVKPTYFLLENVKMKKEYKDIITEHLFGIQPIEINSALVSAQNRKRLYRVGKKGNNGKYEQVEIKQPQDKGILLKDILENEVDEKYYLSDKAFEMLRKYESNSRISDLEGKSYTLNTMQGGHRQPKILATQLGQSKNFGNARGSNKGYTIKTNTGHGCMQIGDKHYSIRKLTPLECERLQTVPDNYTEGVSNSQRYKMLGNGWTVDVIANIFKQMGLK